MGLVYADIELINGEDLSDARRHRIGEDEIRKVSLNILVDTGSYMLAINESIQEQLRLPVLEQKSAQLANGHIVSCDVVGSIELKFKNRRTLCQAMVLPGECEPRLGTITIQDMDVLIDPLQNALLVNPEHPYYAQLKMR